MDLQTLLESLVNSVKAIPEYEIFGISILIWLVLFIVLFVISAVVEKKMRSKPHITASLSSILQDRL